MLLKVGDSKFLCLLYWQRLFSRHTVPLHCGATFSQKVSRMATNVAINMAANMTSNMTNISKALCCDKLDVGLSAPILIHNNFVTKEKCVQLCFKMATYMDGIGKHL